MKSRNIKYGRRVYRNTKIPRNVKKMDTKKDFLSKIYAVILVGACAYFILSNNHKVVQNPINVLDQQETVLTFTQRIDKKKTEFKLRKDIKSQEAIAEQFNPSISKNIDTISSVSMSSDVGVRFSDNENIKSIFQELNEKPFENDIYMDPENNIRRQIAHQSWLDEHLQHKNKAQQEEFKKNFIKTAKDQGYKVHFKKNMKVVLEPLDFDENSPQDVQEADDIKWN